MNVIKFKKLNSTNDFSKSNIDNLQNFDVVSTDSQTSGHGQWGRVWFDIGSENIYLSIILKPDFDFKNLYSEIVRYTAVCICETFVEYGLKPNIKLPNDVMINGKKISGILAEAVTKGETLKGIVVGVGINLNASTNNYKKIDQPVTALNLELNQKVDKNKFMDLFLNRFENNYPDFLKHGVNLKSFL